MSISGKDEIWFSLVLRTYFAVKYEDDVDGMPMEAAEEKPRGGFVPSKWETIDKTELEAQGI